MRQNEMPNCCRVGILHNFPQGLLDKDELAELAKEARREMSYHPVNIAILVHESGNEDDEGETLQLQPIEVLMGLGFVKLGTFENLGTRNVLTLLGHGLGPVSLPELPKKGVMRGRLTENEVEDVGADDFPSCCGARIMYGFPFDDENDEDDNPELPFDDELTLVSLRSDQRRAIATALDDDAVALGTFASAERNKTITLFASGLEEAFPVKAPRKKAAKKAVRRRAA